MKAMLFLAARSAWARRGTLSLVVLSVALSTLLLLGVERLRGDVRQSFSQSVSGTDLIVGARTGPIQLLLYTVFRVGGATHNIRMDSLKAIAQHRAVAWVVPVSLGDSHRGYPVLATTPEYFDRFHYGDRQPLVLSQGRPFGGGHGHGDAAQAEPFGCVLGADVAEVLGYRLGQSVVLSHGDGVIPGAEHGDQPFTVVGILRRTGTPVDRTVHISLQAMQAIHMDWMAGVPIPGAKPQELRAADLHPHEVTAALVGLKNRVAVFAVQRAVAEMSEEPLMAVLPGVALDELWQVVGAGERALLGVSALVAVVSLMGLVAVVLAGLNERRRELAVLRALGAAPRHIWLILAAEGMGVAALGVGLGVALTAAAIVGGRAWLQTHYGLGLSMAAPTSTQWAMLAAILGAAWVASLIPGWRAYRLSLADGLTPRC
ncbi:ABC transporter permease [Ideonella sp. DXS29W]|uniref:ABC transporter permease n=1 Tax=Ideonella lacteola TaxID=2984193 RepID=A0ABU9BQD9_9BURK